MSRIGKLPVNIPEGVKVAVDANNFVTVTGPLGTLTQQVDKNIKIDVNGNVATFSIIDETIEGANAKHGLYRTLVNNMVIGVKDKYKKSLVINGVGYRVQVQGNKLVLNIGYSHPVEVEAVDGISFVCPDANTVEVSGINKELVGQVAAKIRSIKPVEPYHAYGIRYNDEVVIRKEGKKAGKK